MSIAACALGVRTPVVDAEHRAFLREARPWGFILFREACLNRPQVFALSRDLRDAVGHDAVIYVDQEGGRVARMRPPDWPRWPPACAYGALYEKDKTLGLGAVLNANDGPLLDLGCGVGHLSHYFTASRPGRTVFGLDRDFFRLFVAKRYVAPAADFICVPADGAMPFHEGAMSAILSAARTILWPVVLRIGPMTLRAVTTLARWTLRVKAAT